MLSLGTSRAGFSASMQQAASAGTVKNRSEAAVLQRTLFWCRELGFATLKTVGKTRAGSES